MYICFAKIKKCVRIQKGSFPALEYLHKKTKKAEILMMTKDSSFLMLLRFYLICFLPKKALAIPLKNQGKENQCFLKGKLLSETAFCHVHTVPSVQTASFVTGTRIRSPARMCSERIWFNFWILPTICSVFSPSALYSAAMSHRVSPE